MLEVVKLWSKTQTILRYIIPHTFYHLSKVKYEGGDGEEQRKIHKKEGKESRVGVAHVKMLRWPIS